MGRRQGTAHAVITTRGADSDYLKAEAQTISAFLELVVKLNEATFRPLFRKIFDWAFASKSSGKCYKFLAV